MTGNSSLGNSKSAKNDEFYTRLEDIEFELKHYKEHFRGKTVLCNCDDPYESNFFKYFAMNFNHLGLKKLITTCYVTSPVMYTQLSLFDDMESSFFKPVDPKKKPYKVEITAVTDENRDGAFDLEDIKQLLKSKKNICKTLVGDGDFQSDECIELLKEADIVVTNPPFSLFREYMAILIKYDKKFVILGNQNAFTYKDVFPLLKDNKIWTGYHSGHTWFGVPKDYKIPENYLTVDKKKMRSNGYMIDSDGVIWRNLGNICWFTNLDIEKRHEEMILYKNYSPEAYPHYDNYDAIEVSKTVDIPCDYYGVMGVPISFMDHYCPDQFEIVGMCENMDLYGLKTRVYSAQECRDRYFEMFGKKGVYDLNAAGVINGKKTYQRLLIRRKERP